MRIITTLFIATLLPLAAFAQSNSRAPIVIIGDTATTAKPATADAAPQPAARPVPGAAFPNFPAIAITRIGEDTTGQHVEAPEASPAPAAPLAPTASAPANPASPATPASPPSKLWPRDTIQIFMPSCMGFHPAEFFVPCTCTITKLMSTMPHDEFLRLSEAGTIESDTRLMQIRRDCASAPQKKE